MVPKFWVGCIWRAKELALLPNGAKLLCCGRDELRSAVFAHADIHEVEVSFVAISSHRLCDIHRLGHAALMELHVDQLRRKMGGAEVRRAKSCAAAYHACRRSHAWRFHHRWPMESAWRVYENTNVQLLAMKRQMEGRRTKWKLTNY